MRRTNDHCIIDEMSLCLLIVAEKSGRCGPTKFMCLRIAKIVPKA